MTAPPDDTTTDLHAIIAALRAECDTALAREATLAEALATRTAELATRNSEYDERIEHQAATIDVLKVLSASPGDARPVFQLIVERARAFCDADQANLALLNGDMLHLEATAGSSASVSRP
jgi:two-component system, NtrC family, sensor kinase